MRINPNRNAMVAAVFASLAALMMCAAVNAHAMEMTSLRVTGGGVGWYDTMLDYDAPSPFRAETTQKSGAHSNRDY